jgi:hypothetical protein
MRSFHRNTSIAAIAFTSVVLLGAAIALSSKGDRRVSAVASTEIRDAADSFIVHEWGTFTSFSGSDSVKLEFRPLVDADLPPFVLDRSRQSGVPNPFIKSNLSVLQRMETPVTYFYSERERQASVRVSFPQGLLTEFYPPVAQMAPEFKWFGQAPLSGSVLDWGNIWIVPEKRLRAEVGDSLLASRLQGLMRERLLPPSGNQAHYAYARETDSALVFVEQPADKQRPLAPRGTFFEKFLFYRGVGNFDLPLKLTADAGGQFELTNVGKDALSGLFLVTVEQNEFRFSQFSRIEAGQKMALMQSKRRSSADELAEAMVAALIDARLYEKEARAMVKTWRSSWFDEVGTRLFYLLPQTVTNQLLPLEIQPPPDEIIRVMVGRLEIMRPEDEARVTEVVRRSAQQAAAKGDSLPQAIVDLGRLAEPALVRVKNIATDAETRSQAEILLKELQKHREAVASRTRSVANRD